MHTLKRILRNARILLISLVLLLGGGLSALEPVAAHAASAINVTYELAGVHQDAGVVVIDDTTGRRIGLTFDSTRQTFRGSEAVGRTVNGGLVGVGTVLRYSYLIHGGYYTFDYLHTVTSGDVSTGSVAFRNVFASTDSLPLPSVMTAGRPQSVTVRYHDILGGDSVIYPDLRFTYQGTKPLLLGRMYYDYRSGSICIQDSAHSTPTCRARSSGGSLSNGAITVDVAHTVLHVTNQPGGNLNHATANLDVTWVFTLAGSTAGRSYTASAAAQDGSGLGFANAVNWQGRLASIRVQ
jgi:hypothetical protein